MQLNPPNLRRNKRIRLIFIFKNPLNLDGKNFIKLF